MNGLRRHAIGQERSAPAARAGAVKVGQPRWRAAMSYSQGVAMVEAALVLPVLLLLILNVVNFGIYIFAYITVDNAARAAAEYSAYNGVAVQFPGQPTFAAIQSMTNADVSSLPNYAGSTNPTLRICSKFNTSAAVCSGSCTAAGCVAAASLAADLAEPTLYTIWYADVAYTYTPFISAFSIPALGISLTLPATTIHQQTAMRSTQ